MDAPGTKRTRMLGNHSFGESCEIDKAIFLLHGQPTMAVQVVDCATHAVDGPSGCFDVSNGVRGRCGLDRGQFEIGANNSERVSQLVDDFLKTGAPLVICGATADTVSRL